MSRTDRDMDRWFWHDHFKWNRGASKHGGYTWSAGCECDRLPGRRMWGSPYKSPEYGVPSWWKRDQRKQERTKLRQQVQRARNGHVDWDDMPSGEGRMYRRPYYW